MCFLLKYNEKMDMIDFMVLKICVVSALAFIAGLLGYLEE